MIRDEQLDAVATLLLLLDDPDPVALRNWRHALGRQAQDGRLGGWLMADDERPSVPRQRVEDRRQGAAEHRRLLVDRVGIDLAECLQVLDAGMAASNQHSSTADRKLGCTLTRGRHMPARKQASVCVARCAPDEIMRS